jgi:hypothetical protein
MFFPKTLFHVSGWFAVLEPGVLSRDKGEHPDHGVALCQPDPRLQRACSSGVNFTNIKIAAFTHADPKSAKKD